MQDKFTRSARLAIEKAKEFSKSLGHGYVGTEHLLYGLMKTKGSMAEIVLKNHGITEEKLYKTIEVSFATHSMVLVKDAPEFSIRAVRVLENSAKEAKKTGMDKIGSEHILMAIMKADHDGCRHPENVCRIIKCNGNGSGLYQRRNSGTQKWKEAERKSGIGCIYKRSDEICFGRKT